MAYAGKLTYKTELDTSGVQKSGSTIKSIIAGLGITKMISMAMNTISSSMDGAISRFDTMNNFPKVMSNLGISAEESQKSIDKMSEKLAGLPTTLDQGAMAVQRFASKNSDVGKSTDMFLAMNNALLAGGASAETQATALEQISQAYAKGKPDMVEWRSLLTAMPAQANQLGKAFGMSADELGEALRKGDISMDEFMNKVIELNENGIDGFQSFEEQARNATGGIATAITVAKTQVVKGLTDIITGINDGLQQANLPSISEVIASVGRKAKEVLDTIANKLPSVINFLVRLYKSVQPMLPILEAFGAGILAIVVAYTAYQKIMAIVTAVQTAFNVVMAMNPIGLIVLAIVGLIAVLVVLWNKSETFRNIVLGIFDAIKNGFLVMYNFIRVTINLIIAIFTTIVDFIMNNWQGLLLFIVNPFAGAFKLLYDNCEGFRNFVNGFVEKVKSFFVGLGQRIVSVATSIVNAIKSIASRIASVPGQIIGFFTSLPSRMASIGMDIVRGIGNGITNGISWIKNRIKSFVGNVTSFIKKMFKIGSPSILMEDEVGQWLPKGIAVGITANTDSIEDAMNDMYGEMNRTIKMENSKLNFDVMSGNVYNKAFYQTPIAIDLNANVEMDKQKVGRIITPEVSKTIKSGGGY